MTATEFDPTTDPDFNPANVDWDQPVPEYCPFHLDCEYPAGPCRV